MWIYFLLSFVAWVYCFQGFIFGNFIITSDAIAYYEAVYYLVDNLSHGVYPLWEPMRSLGVPEEFFLRRIGSFNPVYGICLLLKIVGLPFLYAYLWSMVGYFFLGMYGFYKTAQLVFKNDQLAFIAYLLLTFSSLATRLFDSYFLLVAIPMIWFFFFLLSFAKKPQRYSLLGITFTLMILFTTYIPFYFLSILGLFLVFVIIFYFGHVFKGMAAGLQFFKLNKFFSLLCLCAFLISLVPGGLFFMERNQKETSLPQRMHAEATTDNNILSVSVEEKTKWGIEEDLMYAYAFRDPRLFKFAVVYIPVWALVLFLLGLPFGATKRLLFFFIWGLFSVLIFSHHLPFFEFLHEYIFYFKYFRNLHFFLWLLILPLGVLMLVEQLRILTEASFDGKYKKIIYIFWIYFVHAVLFGLLFYFHLGIFTSYASIFLSFIAFILLVLKPAFKKIVWVILFAAIIIQPIQIFPYLQNQATNRKNVVTFFRYNHKSPYLSLRLPLKRNYDINISSMKEKLNVHDIFEGIRSLNVYYASNLVYYFYRTFNFNVMRFYCQSQITVFDQVAAVTNERSTLEAMGFAMLRNENQAFVSDVPEEELNEWNRQMKPQKTTAQIIFNDSPEVKVKNYNVNEVQLQTNYDSPKFLVWNSVYHSQWRAWLDQKPMNLYRSNFMFKGVFIPAGTHIIRFRFHSFPYYFFNWFLLILFYVVFAVLITLYIKENLKST